MFDHFSYPVFFVCGFGLYVTMYLWRKGAARWGTWFPLLRKTLEWGLIGVAAALAIYSLYGVLNTELPAALTSLVLAAGAAVPELYLRYKKKPDGEKEETQRGSEVLSAAEVRKRVKTSKQPTFLSLGGIPVPVSAEPYHFLIAGSTGTGKSVAINALLTKIRERGDTAILVDSGGDFLNKHFREETDFVFNPFDDRCVGWSPTLEMQGAWDAQALARSLVPDGIGDSREWNSYAQTFISSVLRKLWESQRLTLADFLYYAQVAPIKELKELLEGTPAMSQLGSEKMFGSIRTIASNYLTSYDYLPTDQEPFSLTQMVQAEHSGVLFITYRDDQLDALRNIIASMLDVASRAVLSLEPNPNRRVWLIIDEFASIGRVQSVEAVATKARKAGGCLVLGVQSVSQLRDRYGENGAQTILSCLSTWLVLRCSDADTAEYMSRYIGEAEVSRLQSGKTSGDTGDSQSQNEQRLTRRTVLASEIQQFENLNGLLKMAGNYPVCRVKLPIASFEPSGTKPFEARNFLKRPLLRMKHRDSEVVDARTAAPAAEAPIVRPAEPKPPQTPPSASKPTAVRAPTASPAPSPAAPSTPSSAAPPPVVRPPLRKPPLIQAPTLPLAQRVALASQAHTLVQALRAQGATAAPVIRPAGPVGPARPRPLPRTLMPCPVSARPGTPAPASTPRSAPAVPPQPAPAGPAASPLPAAAPLAAQGVGAPSPVEVERAEVAVGKTTRSSTPSAARDVLPALSASPRPASGSVAQAPPSTQERRSAPPKDVPASSSPGPAPSPSPAPKPSAASTSEAKAPEHGQSRRHVAVPKAAAPAASRPEPAAPAAVPVPSTASKDSTVATALAPESRESVEPQDSGANAGRGRRRGRGRSGFGNESLQGLLR